MKYLENFYQEIRALVRSGRFDRDDELRLGVCIKRLRHALGTKNTKEVKRQTEALCEALIDALRDE